MLKLEPQCETGPTGSRDRGSAYVVGAGDRGDHHRHRLVRHARGACQDAGGPHRPGHAIGPVSQAESVMEIAMHRVSQRSCMALHLHERHVDGR